MMEDSIRAGLPSITAECMEQLKTALQELGIEGTDDLVLVEERDLLPLLKPIQARKLIASWKKKDQPLQPPPQQLPQPPPQQLPQPPPPTLPQPPAESLHNSNWVAPYQVPWEKMPASLISACEKKERALPSARREMVRIVVKDIIKITSNPGKRNLDMIAERIARKYPASFKDEFEGRIVGTGYASLAKQFITRVENVNRKPGTSLRKRAHTGAAEREGDKDATKGKDSYGCKNWQPDGYPPTETKESQEVHRLWLLEEHSKAGWVEDEVREKMNLTYASQRLWLNGGKKTMTELCDGWPFLFNEKFLHDHFGELVGIDLRQELLVSITSKAPKLFSCLKVKKKMKKVADDIEAQCENLQNKTPICTSILHLLAEYFDEDINLLVKTFDDGVRPEDLDVPDSPFLAAFGRNLAEAERFSLFLDGVAVNRKLHSFFGAVTALFASFYCFNIMYPVGLSHTLEFIQRFFAGINPDRGSKLEKSKKKRSTVSSKILDLTRDLTDFHSEWPTE